MSAASIYPHYLFDPEQILVRNFRSGAKSPRLNFSELMKQILGCVKIEFNVYLIDNMDFFMGNLLLTVEKTI